MPIDVSTFHVEQVVVHDVPRHDPDIDADTAITFSEAEIPDLDASRRNFFRERINASLGGKAFPVVNDPAQPSDVPILVASVLADPANLVSASQEIARTLYTVQNRVNSAALLTVILGSVGGAPCVAVLKLKRHGAVQLRMVTNPDGKRAFSADIFNDLTLSEETKVFKASLFRRDPDGAASGNDAEGDDDDTDPSPGDEPDAAHSAEDEEAAAAEDSAGSGPGATSVCLDGLVSDDQRGYERRQEVADFFLMRFLGCKMKDEPNVATKAVYETSREFFVTEVADPVLQQNYTAALNVDMRSQSAVVDPTAFAEEHLRTEDRQLYLDYLAERGIPEASFDKDRSLIEHRLRQLTLRTEHDLRVGGDPEIMKELVEIEKAEGNRPPRIVINDPFARFEG